MSKKHKEALAKGRSEARAIKRYLDSIGSRRPGRPVTPQSVKARITVLERKIAAEGDRLRRVELVQQRMDAEDLLRRLQDAGDSSSLEGGFINNAAAYSRRKGISYSAWREAGVPAAVLAKAGVKRTRRS